MLRVGLTGGIGAGKSTVARRLAELGATVVDADQVAREVVLPGTVGLARVVEEFGERVLDAEGGLDRPALADIVFGDDDARARLNGILHPLIGQRTAELMAEAPADGILVQDVPLLVEAAMAPAFPLVMVVDAPEDVRVARLVSDRGMTEQAARARMAAQADGVARRAAADVWLDNSGAQGTVRAEVDRLWRDRLLPFEEALRTGRTALGDADGGRPFDDAGSGAGLVGPDPGWPGQFDRIAARIARAAGGAAVRVDHVGPTAVPGLAAPDVIDVQLAVGTLADVDALGSALREVGFLTRLEVDDQENPPGSMFIGADPGRPVRVLVRELGSPGYRNALLLRDWLRAEPSARAEYLTAAGRSPRERPDQGEYAEGWRRWLAGSLDLANRWAKTVGWRTPTDVPVTESTQKV
jgi:dephospho-CoA kinase